MEADLMFEVLMYINIYYFPVFAVAESFVVSAKYISNELWTPRIGIDASVVGSVLISELSKLLIYQRTKDNRRGTNFLKFQIYSFYTMHFRCFCFSISKCSSYVLHARFVLWRFVHISSSISCA